MKLNLFRRLSSPAQRPSPPMQPPVTREAAPPAVLLHGRRARNNRHSPSKSSNATERPPAGDASRRVRS